MSTSVPSPPQAGSDTWRERLLASLRDCGVQRAGGNPAGRWALAIFVCLVLGAMSIVVRHVQGQLDRTEGDRAVAFALGVVWFLFAIFVLVRVRNRFIRQAWQSVARTAEHELMRSNCRRPILYLRSFRLDERIGRPTWLGFLFGFYPLANAEQRLTKALRRVGPVLAIGRPGERLPPLGAARFYVSDELWQKKVAHVAEESQYVVLATGSTEGLKWEVSHLISNLSPNRLILWLHPQLLRLGPAAREAEWQRVLDAMGRLFPRALPEELGEAHFIVFSADWEPIAVAPPKRLFPFASRVTRAIRRALEIRTGTLEPRREPYEGASPDDTFAGCVGASNYGLDLRRLAGFFLAIFAMRASDTVASHLTSRVAMASENAGIPHWIWGSGYPGEFRFDWTSALISAATLTIFVAVAYRWLSGFSAAFAAAATTAVLTRGWISLSEMPVGLYEQPFAALAERVVWSLPWEGYHLALAFLPTLAMLMMLNWATRSVSPRFFAFFYGALAYLWTRPLVVSLLGGALAMGEEAVAGTSWHSFWADAISASAFAAVLTLTVLVTKRRPSILRAEKHAGASS